MSRAPGGWSRDPELAEEDRLDRMEERDEDERDVEEAPDAHAA